ncbi:MAG: histone-like nucleoid-structuring protein Lsr2 [Acidimicrobiales bacterium]
MARSIQVVLTCDVDENDDTDGLETIKFALDGSEYEIDLCPEHLDEFNESIRPYVTLGRKAGSAPGSRRRRRSPVATPATDRSRSSSREDLSNMRQWARANGFKVSDRGRISRQVREAFAASHG